MTQKERSNPLTLIFAGYGHYRISMFYRRKQIAGITTCMPDVDDYNDENVRRHNKGYNSLRNTVIRLNKN